MDNKNNDINNYVNRLLYDKQFLASEFKRFVNNCYSLKCLCGTICSDVLTRLIKAAKKNRRIRLILNEVLWYVNEQSMTDKNFLLIMAFPPKYRNNYIAVLGHMDLAFYQMQVLNRYPQSFEAFSWLFNCICCYDCFTQEDMHRLLLENCDTTKLGIQSCIDSAYTKYGYSTKLQIAVNWIDNM